MKKRFLIILILFFFYICIFNIKAYAASEFLYTLDSNNNATITAYNGSNTDITIPNKIDNYDVKSIGDHAFDESRNTTNGKILTNVTISEGITTIGGWAFVNCINLKSITFPDSLTDLGIETFIGCTNLTTINKIPSGVTSLSDSLFQECGFTEFAIPENVKAINSRTLGICKNLTVVKVYSNDLTYQSNPFEFGSSNLIIYGNSGSTTETFCESKGITFKLLSELSPNTPPCVPISSVKINKESLTLKINDTETLTATILPDNATDKSIIWSSSDTNVATVNNGKVTAKEVGKAIITVSSSDESVKSICNVTVENTSPAPSSNNNQNSSEKIPNVSTNNNTSNKILPETGVNYIICIIILFTIFLIISLIIKSSKYKYIK